MKKGPRPEKPYAAYPLHAHASGQWSARINGKARFFGIWADPKSALARYLAYMNGTPVASAEAVGDRVDAFRLDKKAQLATGDITQVTFDEYETACKVIEGHFGRGRATASIGDRDLTELTEKQWTALTAELGGMPLPQLAEKLGTNTNSIYKLLHDARKKLRRGPEASGITVEDVREAWA
jgi:hypothetical protein